MLRKVFLFFSILFLIYLLWPGPSSIKNFSPISGSAKSTLSGDTVQVPNVTAYFSNNYRDTVTNFYKKNYSDYVKLPFLPLMLNYPPEFAYTAIKDQTESTYLEEFVYPLRDSLFVNGMEPFYQDGEPKYWGATKFHTAVGFLETKATLRFYPSSPFARVITWIGINISLILLYKLGRKIILNA